ncbi:hypothetical protein FHR23_001390 [Stakelama sediminis]|uniref:Uncharacterized protein n=1 Tax=Stakelama sediminis TaxID=463200 RepID=A0A840YY42_9SPHN|nr:hypothetical protein [Stakelama sediminis]
MPEYPAKQRNRACQALIGIGIEKPDMLNQFVAGNRFSGTACQKAQDVHHQGLDGVADAQTFQQVASWIDNECPDTEAIRRNSGSARHRPGLMSPISCRKSHFARRICLSPQEKPICCAEIMPEYDK